MQIVSEANSWKCQTTTVTSASRGLFRDNEGDRTRCFNISAGHGAGEDHARYLAQFLVDHRDKAGGMTLLLIIQSMADTHCLSDDGAAKGTQRSSVRRSIGGGWLMSYERSVGTRYLESTRILGHLAGASLKSWSIVMISKEIIITSVKVATVIE